MVGGADRGGNFQTEIRIKITAGHVMDAAFIRVARAFRRSHTCAASS